MAAPSLDPKRLHTATEQGLLVSENGGRAWRPAHLLPRPVSIIEVATEGSVYAFMLGSGLLRAKESSLNWQTLNKDFEDRYLLHFVVDPKDQRVCLLQRTKTNCWPAGMAGELGTARTAVKPTTILIGAIIAVT